MKEYGFSAKEKLKSQKTISSLFDTGQNAYSYPLKAFYIFNEIDNSNQSSLSKIGVSVSKRKFKKAVDRNLLKRRIKEAYRLNKNDFIENLKETETSILFVYIADKEEEYLTIEKSMKKILKSILNGSKPN